MNWRPSIKHIVASLVAMNVAFIVLHVFFFWLHHTFEITDFMYEIVQRINMDREASVPTWYAQMLLATLSAVFAWITAYKWRKKDVFRMHWLAVTLLALYMSIDEGSELHELATNPVQDLFQLSSGPFFFAWIIPAMLVVLLVVLLLFRFFFHLPRRTQIGLFAGAAVFLLGAVGVEMISGAYWQAQDFQYDMVYRVLNALEEGSENFGTIIAIYAGLDYISKQLPDGDLTISLQ